VAQYTLIDPVTGRQTTLFEAELTQNLQLNCVLLQGREHLGIITHRDLVIFTRWCAGKILARLKCEPDHTVTHALSLVDRWLENEKSITSEELVAAAFDAWDAGATARAAARATAWAAARAAWAASDVARATVHATWAARATWAVSYEAQAQWLVEHLQSGQ